MFEDMIFWRLNGLEKKSIHDVKSKKNADREIELELKNANLYIYSAVIDNKMVGWISLVYMPKVGKYNGKGHIYMWTNYGLNLHTVIKVLQKS